MTKDNHRFLGLIGSLVVCVSGCGRVLDSAQSELLQGNPPTASERDLDSEAAFVTADSPSDAGTVPVGSSSAGSASDGSAVAIGVATGPDASVYVSASTSRDGGVSVVVSTDGGASPAGTCIHGGVRGDGAYTVSLGTCMSDAQCRDRDRSTWDRCLRPADSPRVCAHRYSVGDIVRFDAVDCSAAAECDDGQRETEDFCARAERLVTLL